MPDAVMPSFSAPVLDPGHAYGLVVFAGGFLAGALALLAAITVLRMILGLLGRGSVRRRDGI